MLIRSDIISFNRSQGGVVGLCFAIIRLRVVKTAGGQLNQSDYYHKLYISCLHVIMIVGKGSMRRIWTG